MAPFRHIPALDGLRGLAALMVVVFHTTYLDRAGVFDDLVFRGSRGLQTGVDIFFVLSGFLITAILIHSRGQEGCFRSFYVKRALRILPLYYLLVAISVFGPVLFPILQDNDLPVLPAWGLNYWLFLSNVWSNGPHPILGVAWSLAYEEQFYLLWPFVVFALRGRALLGVCAGLIVLGLCARTTMAFDVSDTILVQLGARLDLLALGGLMACLLYDRPVSVSAATWAWVARRLIWAGGLGLCAIIWVAEGPWGPWMDAFGKLCIGAVTAAVILRAATGLSGPRGLNAVLCSRLLTSWGKYSFAIYLLHSPLDAVLRRVIDLDALFFPVMGTEIFCQIAYWILIAALSWMAGWLSWHLFEMHFLKLKAKLATSPQVAPQGLPA